MRDKFKGTREHNTEIRARILYTKVGRVKELKQKALLLTERVRRTRFGHRLGPNIGGRRSCPSVGVIVIRSTAAVTGSIFFVISHPAAELVGLVQYR